MFINYLETQTMADFSIVNPVLAFIFNRSALMFRWRLASVQ